MNTAKEATAAELKWMVVIPAYNEQATIRPLIESVLQQRPNLLLIVNDASNDKTSSILQSVNQEMNQAVHDEGFFTVLDNARNQGKAACLWRGFEQAIAQNMEVVITMDGDGQHRAEDIPALLKKHVQQPDKLVIGARQSNLKIQPIGRFLANHFANFWISWAAGYGVTDSQSGFRLYPVSLLKKLGALKNSEGFVFESEVIIEAAWQGYFTSVVDIPAIYHKNRRASHFKPWQDIKKITRMVARRLLTRRFNLSDLFAAITNRPAP
ncbi:MAG: glycosyltransferase family 2 protein [Gammaproteobacteria bacterium]|nr:glycosyltransferase family 2 protein [Gammaproteobacteria bacterium]